MSWTNTQSLWSAATQDETRNLSREILRVTPLFSFSPVFSTRNFGFLTQKCKFSFEQWYPKGKDNVTYLDIFIDKIAGMIDKLQYVFKWTHLRVGD